MNNDEQRPTPVWHPPSEKTMKAIMEDAMNPPSYDDYIKSVFDFCFPGARRAKEK